MIRIAMVLALGLLGAAPAASADLGVPQPPLGRFRATCEDLGKLCFATACGRDQIAASLSCRAQCPSAVTMSVVPDACPLSLLPRDVVLRRRG
ncbi:hypothetical protein [Methylobacterium aerolatum]|uniref:Uncharacterized protein n=1 Tax=Methylobacterium aerolatum TaxID=418708 RepID=A0ABU0HVE1_9HYPH|nr:hypothetical protein [Methylobacterium aerolatum]MDQ0446303.1 hypothetical protein [Methylobacterium aerolatum]GJD35646.1 hypothetical protein FMGBMHLM_2558 [Methylobacterium aerolatum]